MCLRLALSLEPELTVALAARSPRDGSPPSPGHEVGTQDLPFGGQQVPGGSFFLLHCEEKVLQVSPLTTHSARQLQRRQDNCQGMLCLRQEARHKEGDARLESRATGKH